MFAESLANQPSPIDQLLLGFTDPHKRVAVTDLVHRTAVATRTPELTRIHPGFVVPNMVGFKTMEEFLNQQARYGNVKDTAAALLGSNWDNPTKLRILEATTRQSWLHDFSDARYLWGSQYPTQKQAAPILVSRGIRRFGDWLKVVQMQASNLVHPERSTEVVAREIKPEDISGGMAFVTPFLMRWVVDPETAMPKFDEIEGIMNYIDQSLKGENNRKYYCLEGVDGQIIGIAGYQPVDENLKGYCTGLNAAELVNVYTDPHFGKKGLGKQLISTVESGAMEAGYDHMILISSPRFKQSAWGFYEKIGYADLGEYQSDYRGQEGSRVFMRQLSETLNN